MTRASHILTEFKTARGSSGGKKATEKQLAAFLDHVRKLAFGEFGTPVDFEGSWEWNHPDKFHPAVRWKNRRHPSEQGVFAYVQRDNGSVMEPESDGSFPTGKKYSQSVIGNLWDRAGWTAMAKRLLKRVEVTI